jgi:hypothetical protein
MNEQIDQPVIRNEAMRFAKQLSESPPNTWSDLLQTNTAKMLAIAEVRVPLTEYAPSDVIIMIDGSCVTTSTDEAGSGLYFIAFDTVQDAINAIHGAATQHQEVH